MSALGIEVSDREPDTIFSSGPGRGAPDKEIMAAQEKVLEFWTQQALAADVLENPLLPTETHTEIVELCKKLSAQAENAEHELEMIRKKKEIR
jgi:hypothetical protein